jgi:hypothetical protein
MPREKPKWKPHKGESTDAEHKDGAIRSSDEGLVMGLEPRGCIVRLGRENNRKREDSLGTSKAVLYH